MNFGTCPKDACYNCWYGKLRKKYDHCSIFPLCMKIHKTIDIIEYKQMILEATKQAFKDYIKDTPVNTLTKAAIEYMESTDSIISIDSFQKKYIKDTSDTWYHLFKLRYIVLTHALIYGEDPFTTGKLTINTAEKYIDFTNQYVYCYYEKNILPQNKVDLLRVLFQFRDISEKMLEKNNMNSWNHIYTFTI